MEMGEGGWSAVVLLPVGVRVTSLPACQPLGGLVTGEVESDDDECLLIVDLLRSDVGDGTRWPRTEPPRAVSGRLCRIILALCTTRAATGACGACRCCVSYCSSTCAAAWWDAMRSRPPRKCDRCDSSTATFHGPFVTELLPSSSHADAARPMVREVELALGPSASDMDLRVKCEGTAQEEEGRMWVENSCEFVEFARKEVPAPSTLLALLLDGCALRSSLRLVGRRAPFAPSVRALALDGEGTGAMIEEVLALLNTEGVSSAPTAGRALRDDGRYTLTAPASREDSLDDDGRQYSSRGPYSDTACAAPAARSGGRGGGGGDTPQPAPPSGVFPDCGCVAGR
mmetsp:Transcript_30550/g.49315  ORF Transcript_30550/g.49315 Transcript_30550/m.49315 type:complete len:342 (-) Transcript_30550:643-1668(-)